MSCDWGTSSFRLRWVSGGEVLREHRDGMGCRALYEGSPKEGREEAFEQHFKAELDKIRGEVGSQVRVPVVVSGMASSTIGWREVPYAELPLRLDGSNVRVEKVKLQTELEGVSAIYLVSGAASECEMMRGEETEAIGLMGFVEESSATLVLPGTHSKHLMVEGSVVTGIQTYMTGELYEVLAKHSMLRASVDTTAPVDAIAFVEGVDRARKEGMAGALFQTRTRQVLQKKSAGSNASFLSGLLIGSELMGLRSAANILLAGADAVRTLYVQAAERLGLEVASVFTSKEVQLAVPRAHGLILSRLEQ